MREECSGNAFKNANKPNFDYLWDNFPHSKLNASGQFVGLPEGQMGNSEAGHLNIGAGRIVYQPLEKMNESIKNKLFYKNEEILKIFAHVKDNKSKLHIMGLISDGGVHSHVEHLLALVDMIKDSGITDVYYHLFTDGRDTNPKSSYSYIKMLEDKIQSVGFGIITTISGRYYAMDRDNNYERTQKAYDAIVNGIGPKYNTPLNMVETSYANNVTDEFLIPAIINDGKVEDSDGIITFNFRPDRLRQLFTAFTNPNESPLKTKKLQNLRVLTMFPVTESVHCPHAFESQDLTNTLGEYLNGMGLSQLRIAETEKYAHVTYYFDGGTEQNYDGMNKILIPSPKVATYDLLPEMSAHKITETLLDELDKDIYDVIILNYANGDMVGHTGNYDAAVKAVECLDECLGVLYNKVKTLNGTLIITADHGNCEIMWDKNKLPVTSHTTSLVPFIIAKPGYELKNGNLCDIAPTMLELLEIEKPKEMTGESLIKS